MTTEKLLAELGARNIRLRRERDELVLIGNQAALEPSLLNQVRAHKASLLELVGNGSSLTLNPGVRITPEMVTLVQMTQEEIDEVVKQVRGGAANVQDIYPLAPLQEGILFHHLLQGQGDPYVLGVLMRFESRERLEKYVEAVQWVVKRHDILRTGIVWEGVSAPVQVVWRKAEVGVEEVELGEGGDAGEKLYERFHPRRVRMDVTQAPLLRLVVAQDRADGSWLMMRLVHHLVGDHHSTDLMQEEIGAYLQGREGELPEAGAFREVLAEVKLGARPEEQERYFREMLGDVKEATAPFGLLHVLGDGSEIVEATLKLEEGLMGRIRERARKLRVSAAILFHLGWACVVARTSGRDEAVFGTVLLGQLRRGMSEKRVMGVFINTLPVRIGVGEEAVEEAVRKTQKVLAELARHERASLVLAQRCSGVAAPQPLFTSVLNYRHIRVSGIGSEEAPAWKGISNVRGEERSNYPVSLSVNDSGNDTSVTAQADVSLDPMRVCRFMRKAMESLVEALETAPSRKVSTINVIPADERQQVLYEWNATAVEYPGNKCIHEIFEEQVRKSPHAIALAYEDSSLSYGELNRRANRIARYLRELGVETGNRVAICMERGLEMIEAVLAVLKAGAAYVPLDPAYPAERLRFMLADSASMALLVQGHLQSMFHELSARLPVIDISESPRWREQPESNLNPGTIGLTPEHLAYTIYTSGTTGTPKGVMIEHRSVCNLVVAQSRSFTVEAGSRILQFSSFSFDACVWEIWMALAQGASMQMVPKSAVQAGNDLDRGINQNGITHITLPPAVLAVLPDHATLGSLSTLIVAGDSLSRASVSRWASGRLFINAYGPTESTVCATVHVCRLDEKENPPIGKPIANMRLYILDRNLEPVPVSVTGELYIGGAGVAQGYWKRTELTAERFLPDPFAMEGGARMYRTGDLGKWRADGEIEFLGRNDHQVKVRGFRIELGEIEAVLTEVAEVREAIVLVREDHPGAKRLVAYYTTREQGAEIGAEQLRAHAAGKLPEHMVPAAYVRMESLPLTANGKVDRQALPRPEGDAYAVREYEAPQGLIETVVAQIWSELLGVEQVGRKDNFFELGGHSLLALQVIARIQRQLGREAAVKDLFAYPQLESLAALLELPRDQGAERALPIREHGTEPPLFFPHGADDQTGYAWTIAPHIDSAIPVYELPAQQPKVGSRLRTIEGQAQRMVRMIRAVQPVGPYRIAAYCFGSFLAYEVARQLVGADEEVFLSLLNFRLISGHTDKLPLVARTAVSQDLKVKFLNAIRDHVAVSKMPESVQEAVAELRQSPRPLEELFYHCKDMGWLPEPWVFLTPARLQRMLVHLVDMERGPYLFSLLPVNVHMFVAQDAKGAAELPADFLALVPGTQLKCFPVPGTHETMVQNPNAKHLGASLSGAIRQASKAEERTSTAGSLVCLTDPQSSSSGEISVPLFCVPGAAMHARCFADLASSFRVARPVFGFQARGWEGAIPHTTIESEARFYLKELETVCPSGPVHLLGYLRGGWVAFEMALMLQAAGREVQSLTLVETALPDENSRTIHEYTLREVVGNLLVWMEDALGRAVIPLADLEQEGADRQREILLELLEEAGVLAAGATYQDLYGVLHMLGTGLRTRYMPHRAFSGVLHLIHALEGQAEGGEENGNRGAKTGSGWERWAAGVREYGSCGNRITMLHLPHGKTLAKMIEEEMNRATGNALSRSAAST